MGDTSVDVRHLKTFDTVVRDVGHELYVVDVELAVFFSFGIDLAEELDLCVVEVFAHFLHHPDVAEELGTEVTVSDHRLSDHAQVGVDELDDLVLRTDLAGCHLVELVGEALQLRLDDGGIDLFLIFDEVASGRFKGWNKNLKTLYKMTPIYNVQKVIDMKDYNYMFNIFN